RTVSATKGVPSIMPPPDFVCAIPLLAQSPLADFQKANTDTEPPRS
ncbi:MAG: hypothetical protein ACI9DF_003229, partial [Verrucomicrobiales bacterium]